MEPFKGVGAPASGGAGKYGLEPWVKLGRFAQASSPLADARADIDRTVWLNRFLNQQPTKPGPGSLRWQAATMQAREPRENETH